MTTTWQELLIPPALLMSSCAQLQLPKTRSKALNFTGLNKAAITASIMLAQQLFTRLGMRIKFRGLDQLRGRRVVFVANHQGSNLDPLVIALILLAEKGKTPLVPASERLLQAKMIGGLNKYLQHIGPFFIRESFDNDAAYIEQVADFMDALLDEKQYLLLFFEGDTSRSGKPRVPKRGLFKSLLRRDVTFCPVSLTYESALNDSSNQEHTPIHTLQALTALTTRQVGTCYVNFGACIDGGPENDHKAIVKQVTDSVYSEIPILSQDLLAVIMLDKRSLPIREVQAQLTKLEDFVRQRRLPLIRRSLETCLRTLSHAVKVSTDDVLSVSQPAVLSFYRNRAIQAFFDLARLPPMWKYECWWVPSVCAVNTEMTELAQRWLSPLLPALVRVLRVLGEGGTFSIKTLREQAPLGEVIGLDTLNNLLLALEEAGAVKREGRDQVVVCS